MLSLYLLILFGIIVPTFLQGTGIWHQNLLLGFLLIKFTSSFGHFLKKKNIVITVVFCWNDSLLCDCNCYNLWVNLHIYCIALALLLEEFISQELLPVFKIVCYKSTMHKTYKIQFTKFDVNTFEHQIIITTTPVTITNLAI